MKNIQLWVIAALIFLIITLFVIFIVIQVRKHRLTPKKHSSTGDNTTTGLTDGTVCCPSTTCCMTGNCYGSSC